MSSYRTQEFRDENNDGTDDRDEGPTRMAGDKLEENTKESQDAAEALSRSERNKQTREAIGNDPERLEERISGVDREEYDLSGFSDKEINMALKGGTFDQNDYDRLTGNETPVNPPGGGIEPPVDGDPVIPEPVDGPAPTPPPINTGGNMPAIPTPGGGSGFQPVVQDNDQVSSVVGDGNTVNQDQDNTVKSFGGRSFNPTDWKKSWMNSKFAA